MYTIKKTISLSYLLTIVMLFFFMGLSRAQVAAYTFSQAIAGGGYQTLTGATTTVLAAPWDNQAAVQVPIGFTFNYDSVNFTQCYVSPNGFITFGTVAPAATLFTPLSDNTVYNGANSGGVLAPMASDWVSNGSNIVYAITGTAPNRTFIIQWTNAERKMAVGDFNFQIRLAETTNIITFSYGNCDTTQVPTNVPVQVGLRGINNDIVQGNVFNRIQGSSQLWGNTGATTAGFANNSTLNTDPGAYPNFGLEYKYTPGLPCVAPTSQPSALVLGATSITSTAFVGNSFVGASPVPSKYIILRSTTNVQPTATSLVNRISYPLNTIIGIAPAPVYRVVANSNSLTFTQSALASNTTYYYWVFSYSDKCSGAPVYNTVSPLFGSATTCFQSTTALAANPIGGNGFTANWTAVSGVTNYQIDVSTNATFTSILPAYNNFSVPAGTTSLAVSGLLPFTNYYYRVRAIGSGCIVNSVTITVTTTCGFYTIPYVQNFDTTLVNSVPLCYSVVNANSDTNVWRTQDQNFSSASNSIQIDAGSNDMNDWFFLPGLSMTGGISYRLKFSYNTGNLGASSENLSVFYGTTQNVSGMVNSIVTINGFDTNYYETVQIDFTPSTTGIYYLGFLGNSIANQSYIVVDDISVTLSPTCIEPTSVNATNVSATVATINWTAATTVPPLGYQYYIATTASPPTVSTVPTGSVGVGANTLNLTGLLPSTSYWIWVRGSCTSSDKSTWSIEETFNTECSIPVISSTAPVTRCGYGAVTLNATSSVGSAIRWFDDALAGTQVATGTSFTTPALSASTTYYAEARSFGAIAKMGPANPSIQMGLKTVQNFQAFINFTILSATSLQSVDIFPMVSGQTGKILIRNSNNIAIGSFPFSTLVSGGNTVQQIAINFQFSPGMYNLYFETLPLSGLRMNSTNAVYPYVSSVAEITGNNIDDSYQLAAYNWKFTTECLSARVPVSATITAPPSLALSTYSATICDGEVTPTILVLGAASYSSLVWTPNTGISGSITTGFTFNPTTTTTYSLLANQNSGSLCGNIVSITIIVKQAPPNVSILPINPTVCNNGILPLLGSTSIATPAVVLNEQFNASSNGWTVANTSTGGDVLASQWTLKPNGYNYLSGLGWNPIFFSNDASQFYLSNSDSQSGTLGTVTRTTLTSPSFSLAGFTSANLNYWQYIRAISYDKFNVEISTNGGATWITIYNYLASQGTQSSFSNAIIDLVAYLGFPNLKIRFNYESNWGYCWAIDNVLISGTLNAGLTWMPTTDLYMDPAATVPYVSGDVTSVVYTKPTNTITYTATLTGSNGCIRTTSNLVTLAPDTIAGLISASQSLCDGSPASDLILMGSFGTVVGWESADDAAFTLNVTPIANTTTTLTVAEMGAIGTIRYFRAIVKNSTCNQLITDAVFVSYYSTTWNGSSWSNGIPTSSTRAIFEGSYTSTTNLYACSVRINSGDVVFNTGNSLVVTNDVVVFGGTLTFQDAASLVQINNSMNSGVSTYIRNTTPMRLYDYSYWSTPVAPQTLDGLSPLTLYDKYFKYDATIPDWVSVPSSTLMEIGKGYIIRAPNSYNSTTGTVFSGSFVGVANNGTYTTPIVVSSGNFNLIGNPYPSALSADLFLSNPLNIGVVDATIYLWTHNTLITANQYTSNDYAVYNYLGGTGTNSAPNIGINTSVPDGKIATGQSFFIKGISNGEATFTNSMRLIGDNDRFFRRNTTAAEVEEKHRIWLDIANESGAYKQTLVGYTTPASLGFDRGLDGDFINVGNSAALYSVLGSTSRLTIQGRPLPFTDMDEVPLGFYAGVSENYTISLFHFDGLFANQAIYLKDTALNVIHNLKQAPYTFLSNAGTFNSRFVLVYRDATLENPTNSSEESNIILYKPNQDLHVYGGTTLLKSIKVYDIRGRLLVSKDAINATTTSFNVGTTNQVLWVEITTADSNTIIKKYLN
jgi:hypothetical protein